MGQGAVSTGYEAEFPVNRNSPLTLDVRGMPSGAVE